MSPATASAARRCSPAASPSAARRFRSTTSISARSARTGSLAEQLQGFSWLRDLAAAASREKGARLAEAVVGRWLLAHGTRVDEAWAPHLWGERILFWTAYAPYILSSSDAAIARRCSTRSRAAPATSTRSADKAAAGPRPRHRLVRRGRGRPARPGRRPARRARRGGARPRARLRAVRRWRADQPLAVRAGAAGRPPRACCAPAISPPSRRFPDGIEAAAAASLAALHGVTLGDGALSSWQGCGPGEPARLDCADRRLRAARAAAAAGARLGLSAAVGAGHDRSSSTPRRRRRRRWRAQGSRLDAGVRAVATARSGWSSIAAGRDRCRPICPTSWSQGLRTTAAHSTLVLADTNSTNILADGSLGKGVEDVTIDRSEDNDASRLEASHDGYVRAFGLVHKRSLMLGNDGKELRGADQLIAKGRKKIRESAPYRRPLPPRARRRGDDHRRRHGRDPALEGRAAVELPLPRRQCSTTEESLWIDGRGQPHAHDPARHRRRSVGAGRRNRLAVPPRQLIRKDHNDRPRSRSPGTHFAFGQERPRRACRRPRAGTASRSSRPAAPQQSCARLAPRCATSRDLTGFPEMMDGRVKTLHPKVHGGLLGVRDNPEHAAAMEEHGIAPIDLVVVNLYPFLRHGDERRRPRHDHREYRHRRPVDGPLGGEEPRPCRDRHRSRRLCRAARRARRQRRQRRRSSCARGSRPRRSR